MEKEQVPSDEEGARQGPLLDKCTPGFIRGLEDTEVIIGRTIKIECQFFGIPEVGIEWYKDGGPIQDNERLVFDITDDVASLTIRDAVPDDQAWYRCNAFNEIGTSSTDCEVLVVERPKFVRGLEDTIMCEGDDIQFTVQIEGEPDVSWYKGDVLLEDQGRYVIVDQDEEQIFTLAIEDVLPEDEGIYRCVAENEAGRSESVAKINVTENEYPPEFTNKGQDEPYSVKKDGDLTLNVALKGKPFPDVHWFKDDKPLPSNFHYDISEQRNENSLSIHSVTLDDRGVYKCEATSKLGKITRKFQVNIEGYTPQGEAPKFIEEVQPTEVKEGAIVKFQCKAKGEPAPDVEWYKDDELLGESDRVKIEINGDDVCVLTIENVSTFDEAVYKALARNPLGTTSCCGELLVEEPVSKPEFIQKMSNAEVKAGEDACFCVRVKGDAKVDWYKNDQLLEDAGHVVIVDADNAETFTLAMEEATVDDSGDYKCVAHNKAGEITCSASLKVTPKKPVERKSSKERRKNRLSKEAEKDVQPVGTPEKALPDVVGKTTEMSVEDTPPEPGSPVVLRSFKDCEVIAGSTMKLECQFTGTPTPDVEWLKDGGPLEGNDRITCTVDQDVASMVITETEPDDEGWYRCRISNVCGTTSVEAELIVVEKPKFVKELEDVEIDEGEDIQFTVQIDGEPDVSWYKGDVLLEDQGRYVIVDQDEDQIFTLAIEDVVPEDEGEYRCVAENEAGKSECVAKIFVTEKEYPPEFTNEGQDEPYVVKRDGELTLSVALKGKPFPDVQWFKDSKPLRSNFHYDIAENGKERSLTVHSVTVDDRGVYKCEATSKLGKATRKFQANIEGFTPQGTAPEIVKSTQPVEVKEGKPVKFECEVKGEPTPEIEWYKDNQLLDESDRFKFDSQDGVYTLTIDSASPFDEAEYKLLARNPVGTTTCSAELIVEEPVSKPELIQPMEDVEVKTGEDGCFRVRVKGNVSVDWFKNDKLLEDAGHVVIVDEDDGETFTLAMEEATVKDSGVYKCLARNKAGEVTSSASLKVIPSKPSEVLPTQKKTSKDKKPASPREIEKTVELTVEDTLPEPGSPLVLRDFKDCEVIAGSTMKLECQFTGTPTPDVEWLKDGGPLEEHDRITCTVDQDVASLVITKTEPDDEGWYRCRISNERGTTSVEAELIVVEKPKFVKAPEDVEIDEGEDVQLTVQIEGEPDVSWYKGDVLLEDQGRYVIVDQDEDQMFTLAIEDVLPEDEGEYRCVAENEAGKSECAARIFVTEKEYPPEFTNEGQDEPYVVKKDDDLTLRATLKGKPSPDVQWFIDNKPLRNNLHYEIAENGNERSLTIHAATLDDRGVYKCEATSKLGKAIRKFQVNMGDLSQQGMSPEIIQRLIPIEVKEGGTAKFQCRVFGKPEPEIEWYKEDKLLEESDQVKFEKNEGVCVLTLSKVSPYDEAEYKVLARNPLGTATSAAELLVEEAVSKPELIQPMEDVMVKVGEDGCFRVRVKGDVKVDWYKNNQLLEDAGHVVIVDEDDGETFTLAMEEATLEDCGVYKCVASNKAGEVTCKATLKVSSPEEQRIMPSREPVVEATSPQGSSQQELTKGKIPPSKAPKDVPMGKSPYFAEPQQDVVYEVNEGDTVSFNLNVHGTPEPTVEWFKDDEVLSDSETYRITKNGGKHELLLKDIIIDQSAVYKCVASNEHGTEERTFKVDVEGALSERCGPSFLRGLKDCEILAGSDLKFECQFFGTPEPTVEWFKDGGPLEVNDRVVTTLSEGLTRLTIRKTEPDDEGWYRCKISNPCGVASQECEVIVVDVPRFVKGLEDLDVDEGEDVQLTVLIEGEPDVSWYKGDVLLQDQGRYVIVDQDEEQTFTLAIEDALPEDEGEYRCVAENEAGRSESVAKVFVTEKEYPPEFTNEGQDEPYFVKKGDDLTLTGALKGKPFPAVQWFKNDQPLRNSNHYDMAENGNERSLSIHSLTLDDRGVYKCEATSKLGKATRKFQVNLEGLSQEGMAPEIVQKLVPVEAKAGQTVKFQCRVLGKPAPEIEWYKDEQLLEESDKVLFDEKDGTNVLTIRDITPFDEAEYKVLARNPIGTSTYSAELLVVEAVSKPEFLQKMNDVEVKADEDGCFSVRVKGDVKVDWYKNDQLLEDAGHVVIVDEDDGETFTLAMEEATVEDSGVYKCVASNKAGEITCSAWLRVIPGKPLTSKKPIATPSKKDVGKVEKPGIHENERPVEKQPTPSIEKKVDEERPTTVAPKLGKEVELTVDGESTKVAFPGQKGITPKEKSPPAPVAKKPSKEQKQKTLEKEQPLKEQPTTVTPELGKEVELTIDGESLKVVFPEQKDDTPRRKPVPDKKPSKDKKEKTSEGPQRPSGTHTKAKVPTIGKEVQFTVDTEPMTKEFPEQKDIPKESEPETTTTKGKRQPNEKQPVDEQSKPLVPTIDKEVELTFDSGTMRMNLPNEMNITPKSAPTSATKKSAGDKKQKTADEVESVEDEPTSMAPTVGKDVQVTIDGDLMKIGISEQKTPGTERSRPVAPGKKPTKGIIAPQEVSPPKVLPKPLRPTTDKTVDLTIDGDTMKMSLPKEGVSAPKRPNKEVPTEKRKKAPTEVKPVKAEQGSRGQPVGKEVQLTVDNEPMKVTSPEEETPEKVPAVVLPGTKTTKDKKAKPPKEVPPVKTKPKSSSQTVGKPVTLTVDSESGKISLPEQEPISPKQKPSVVTPGRTIVEDKKPLRPDKVQPETKQPKPSGPTIGKEIQLTIDGDSVKMNVPQEEVVIPKLEPTVESFPAEPSQDESIPDVTPKDYKKKDTTPPAIKMKPKKRDSSPEDKGDQDGVGKLAYTTKRDDGLPVWARRPRAGKADEETKRPKDKSKERTRDVKKPKPEEMLGRDERSVRPEEAPELSAEKDKKQKTERVIRPDEEQHQLEKTKKPEDRAPKPEVKSKRPEEKKTIPAEKTQRPDSRVEVPDDKSRPEKDERRDEEERRTGKKGGIPSEEKRGPGKDERRPDEEEQRPSEKARKFNDEEEMPVGKAQKPTEKTPGRDQKAKIPESVKRDDTPEEPAKQGQKPEETTRDKKDKLPAWKKREDELPEWARRSRTKDTPPSVKPKGVRKPTTRKAPSDVKVPEDLIAPEFIKGFEEAPTYIREGDDLNLKVQVKGQPQPEVEWFKDEVKIQRQPRYTTRSDGDTGELIVKNVTPDDNGSYKCVATNDAGRSSRTFDLKIKGSETPREDEELSHIKVPEGSTATIECAIPKTPGSQIQWLKGNKPVTSNKRIEINKTGDHSCLVIHHVTPDDQNSYTCIVTNRKGVSKTTVFLQVSPKKKPGRFIQEMSDLNVTKGGEAKFDVRIEGVDLEVDWYRDDELIDDAGRFIIEDPHPDSDDNLYSLTIEDCCPEDSGVYKCVANCDGNEVMTCANLRVLPDDVAPDEVTKPKEEFVEVVEGERLELDVIMKEVPGNKVTWYKDDRVIRSDRYYDIDKKGDDFIVVIKQTAIGDAGVYKCVVSGPTGSVAKEFRVDVKPKKIQATKPVFKTPLKANEVNEGSSVHLECVVTGEPAPDIEWYKDNKRLTKNSRIRFDLKGDNATLTIKAATVGDTGRYRCVAINPAGTAESVTDVNIRMATVAPKYQEKLKSMDAKEGERVALNIRVSGQPDLTWYKDGKLLKLDDRITEECLDQEKGIFVLHLDDVKRSDAGRYKCVAKNPKGETFCSMSLQVKEKVLPPVFGEVDLSVSIQDGEDLVLEVPVSGKPLPKVTWYKDNVQCYSSTRCKIQSAGDMYKLTIKPATGQDAGVYKVVAKSSAGSSFKEIHVTVAAPEMKQPPRVKKEREPPVFTKKMADVKGCKGGSAVFEVHVPGEPELDWYKDGVLIEDEGRFVIEDPPEGEELYRLTVEDCVPSDSGTYTCLIKNDVGEAQCSAKLIMPGYTKEKEVEKPKKVSEVVESAEIPILESVDDRFKKGGKVGEKPTPVGRGKTTPGESAPAQTNGASRKKIPKDTGPKPKKKESAETIDIDRVAKPKFLNVIRNSRVKEGESIVLEVEAKDEPLIDWYKDDKLLDDGGRIIIEDAVEGDTLYRLTICDSVPEDSGNYKCVAVNDVGETSCTAYIEVKKDGALPEFIGGTMETTLNIPEGQDGRIDVEIRSRPETKVSWFKNGIKLRNDRHVDMSKDGNGHFITVMKMMKSDSGVYKCVASNNAGSVSKEFQVSVTPKERKTVSLQKTLRKPQFIERLKHTDVNQGDDIIFTVRLSGEPNVEWYHDNRKLEADERIEIDSEGDDIYRLKIKDSLPSDAGRYKCVAKNIAGETSCVVSLRVKEAFIPPEFICLTEDVLLDVNEGEDISFSVKVRGHPEPKITWFKDGVRLRGEARVASSRDGDEHTLTIRRVSLTDAGKYKCAGTSPAGTSSVEFELRVNAKQVDKRVPDELGDRPIFTEKMSDVDVCQGGKAVFSVRASDSPKIEWYRGETLIENKGRFVIKDAVDEGDLYQLVIEDVKTEDIGTYVCRVTNDVGKSSCSANLYVDRAVTVPLFVGKEEPIAELFEGDELRLRVCIKSFPKPDVVWFRNGVRLRGDAYVKIQPVNDEYNLTVRQLKKTDSGMYRVEATTEAGSAFKEFNIEVKEKQAKQDAPRINKPLKENYDLEEGNILKLQCDISGRPAPEMEWFKDDEPVDESRHIQIDNVSGLCTLKIKNVRPEHSGTYKCVARNTAGTIETKTEVKVRKEVVRPEMKERLRNKDVREGETVKLEIRVTGEPELTWTKNGKIIKSEGRFVITTTPAKNHAYSLEITNCKPEDSGRYKCVAKNTQGQVFCSSTLTVLEKQVAPAFLDDKGDLPVDVKEGDELRLEVNVSGKPEPRVKWFKDNVSVMQTSRFRLEQKGGRYCLVVLNVRPTDGGVYKCVASSNAGSVSKLYHVEIKASTPEGQSPVFVEDVQPVKTKEGRTAALECKVKGQPSPKVEWHKDDGPITQDSRVKAQREGDYCRLSIKDTKLQDSGVYMCVAFNDFGSEATSAELEVEQRASEPVFVGKLESVDISEGKEAVMKVKVTSTPAPTINWYKDGKDLVSSGRCMLTSIVEDGIYSLVIRNCDVRDTGRYTCLARNEAGEAKCSARLDVKPSLSGPVFDGGDQEEPVVVKEGDKLRLEVNVRGKPSPKVKWYKDGRLLLSSSQLFIKGTGGEFSLEIPRVGPKDAGVYKCVASSTGGASFKLFNVKIPDTKKAKEFDLKTREKIVEKKPAVQEELAVEIEPELETQLEQEIEAEVVEPDGRADGDGLFKPEFLHKLQDLEVVEGSAARFDVRVKGNPEPEIDWYKNNQMISDSKRVKFLFDDDGLCSLVIKEITTKDRGRYKCVASNSEGKVQCSCEMFVEVHGFEGSAAGSESDSEPLTPKSLSSEFIFDDSEDETTQRPSLDPPQITLVLRSKTVTPGNTVKFACRYQSTTSATVEWTKDGKTIRPDARHKLEDEGDLCALQVTNVVENDAGEYVVVVKNEAGHCSSSASLQTEDSLEPERDGVAPKFVLKPNKTVDACITCRTRMECKAVGDPKPDVRWYKEKLQIISNDKFAVYTDEGGMCTLTVEDVTYEDEGTYKAVASNNFGKVSCATKLIVKAGDISSDDSDGPSGSDQGSIKERPIPHSLRAKKPPSLPSPSTSDSKRVPEFTMPLRDKQTPAGSTVRLTCRAISKGRFTTKWYRDEQPVRNGGRYDVRSDFASQTLVVRDCRVEDSGEYRCEARGVDGVASTTAVLTVEDRGTGRQSLTTKSFQSRRQISSFKTSKDEVTGETDKVRILREKDDTRKRAEKKYDTNVEQKMESTSQEETQCAMPDVVMTSEEKPESVLTRKESETTVDSPQPSTATKGGTPSRFVAASEVVDQETGKQFLIAGDIVEVLDTNPSGLWLVRRISRSIEIGFALETILEEQRGMEDDEIVERTPEEETDEPFGYHVFLTNYKAKNEDEVSVSIDDEIDVLDDGNGDYWFIDNLTTEQEGLVPAYFVQEVSEEEYKRIPRDQNVRAREARNQRTNVVHDLIEGERKYVKVLRFVIENHVVEMEADDLPKALVGKKDELFSNIKEIFSFHTRIFVHELEACVNEPNDLAKVFLRHKNKLQIYAKYLQDRVKAESLFNDPEISDFFKEFQEDTEDPLFITDYLNKPVERLKEYQNHLQDLLKYTARANLKCRDVEEALEVASKLSQQATDVLRIASLDMYPGEIPLQQAGRLLRQGSILFWDDKPRGKGKERELFLFDKVLINARRKEDGKRYTCKFAMKISNLGITEEIEGEPKKWSLWVGNSVQNALVLHTFEAKTVEIKESWVNAIKDLITTQGGAKMDEKQTGSGRRVPAVKERLVTNSNHQDVFAEVEKQYVVVTPPKVSPKPKPQKNKPQQESVPLTSLHEAVGKTKQDEGQVAITKGPQPKTTKPGETVVFSCEFSGDPEPTITWSKDGATIEDEGRFLIIIENGYTELEIDKVESADVGDYKISVKNSHSNAWASAQLVVETPSERGTPKATKNDGKNKKETKRNWVGKPGKPSSFKLQAKTQEDSPEVEEKQANVEGAQPVITHGPQWTRAKPGDDVAFTCEFTGDPVPQVTWSKDGAAVKNGGRVSITIESGYSELKINKIVPGDAGTYQILLKNAFGNAWASGELDMSAPPNITRSPKGVAARLGESASFPCNFTGIPEPSVSWTKGDVAVKNEGRFHIVIEKGFTELKIDDLVKSDDGNYKVSLKNSAGSYWASAGLVVYADEDEIKLQETSKTLTEDVSVVTKQQKGDSSTLVEGPQDQQVEKGSAFTLTAKVSCTGAEPKITWKKDGKAIGRGRARMTYEKEVASLKCTRADYGDAGVYTVEIDDGSGIKESSATVEVSDVPEPPTPPDVSDITTNSVKLAWRAMKDGNSPIMHYVVEYRKTGEKDWTAVSKEVTSSSFVVPDLTPRTSYRFRVSAVNKRGTSRPSRFSGLIETKK